MLKIESELNLEHCQLLGSEKKFYTIHTSPPPLRPPSFVLSLIATNLFITSVRILLYN